MDASLNGPFGRVTLSSATLTIGRLPDNQVVINDPKSSSRHAEIRPTGMGYTITDVESTNGTFVNEQQLERNTPRPLNPGDVVRIGDTRFTYEASDAPLVEPTVYANQGSGSHPGYDPTVAVPPPTSAAGQVNTAYGGGAQQDYQYQSPPPIAYSPTPSPSYGQPQSPYQPSVPPSGYSQSQAAYPQPGGFGQPGAPYGQPQVAPPYGYPVSPRKRNRTLFIVLASVIGGVVLVLAIVGAAVYANRSTPEKTLNTFCNSLKNKDYQTAYNQLANSFQTQVSEGQFESAFTANGTPQVTSCAVSNTYDNGSTGYGTLRYVFNNGRTVTEDYRVIYENGAWKINSGTQRT